MSWTIVLHGGAGQMTRASVTPSQAEGAREALGRALDAAAAILQGGGVAIDAVEAAVRVLEDDPHFNSGRGAALTYEGIAELDAAIMDGRDRNAGAVAGVIAEVTALGGSGGIIATGPQGDAVWHFTTPGMYRARLTSGGGREIAVFGDE